MRFCAADGRLLFMDVEGWGLEFLPYFKKKKKKNMGAGTSSLERHIEQAKKTGACNLEGMSLTKVRGSELIFLSMDFICYDF